MGQSVPLATTALGTIPEQPEDVPTRDVSIEQMPMQEPIRLEFCDVANAYQFKRAEVARGIFVRNVLDEVVNAVFAIHGLVWISDD